MSIEGENLRNFIGTLQDSEGDSEGISEQESGLEGLRSDDGRGYVSLRLFQHKAGL